MLVVEEILVAMGAVSKDEKMMRLIIILEAAAPSAQILILSLNQAGAIEVASLLSYMYVFQYVSSMFTITMWTSIASKIFYR